MRNKNILFIGLGTMGYHMAGHLSINKKINAFVWNRSVNKINKWLKNYDGKKLDNHLHNDFFDTFILCLKDDNSIYDVLVKNKFIKYLKPNSTIIDHSTTSLEIIETITKDKSFQHKNIKYIDAPFSGGEQDHSFWHMNGLEQEEYFSTFLFNIICDKLGKKFNG